MRFKVDGRELEAVENIRVGEACEAEKALNLSMADSGFAGMMAVSLYVAMRREDPKKPAAMLADEVMAVELTSFEEVEEEDPPAEGSGAESEPDPENPPTSGPPPSDQSE